MQSDLQHKEYETLIGVTDEGHDETVQDSKSTPMGDVKGGANHVQKGKYFKDAISLQFYHEHAAIPYGDEKWDNYRKTMHWLKPQVTLAARLALNFAGQTVDFRRHRDDYQMVCNQFWRQKVSICLTILSSIQGHTV